MPTRICPDGVTTAGPTGRCLAQPDGTCHWEVTSCPSAICAVVSFGPSGQETGFYAKNFVSTLQAKRWSLQFAAASLEILPGTCAEQELACPDLFAPVCASLSGAAQQTYGNRCELRSATIAAAGATSAAKSSVESDGECVPDASGPSCGGIAGIPCPGMGRCVDDPTDNCDPNNGGADCGGICSCIENALCVQGSHFDSDPNVCACVPDAVGVPCGSRTCDAGQICCSASCGICGVKGGLCPQIACATPL
jgi:hypothetical protein